MSRLVFLDSNIFIWAYNRPDSNSAKILDLMDEGKVSVIISEKVLEEVKKYFLRYYNEDVWFSVFKHVITSAAQVMPVVTPAISRIALWNFAPSLADIHSSLKR